jgi:hypothetical protein
MRLWGNAKIGCSSMSRCGLVCFGMQVHGSTPGDSQRVENVAIIDTGLARNPQPGMSQKGGHRPYGHRLWNARNRRKAVIPDATGDDEAGENQRRRSRAPRRAHCRRPNCNCISRCHGEACALTSSSCVSPLAAPAPPRSPAFPESAKSLRARARGRRAPSPRGRSRGKVWRARARRAVRRRRPSGVARRRRR